MHMDEVLRWFTSVDDESTSGLARGRTDLSDARIGASKSTRDVNVTLETATSVKSLVAEKIM